MTLEGKKGVVFGVANHRSIAWAIAKAANDAGAELAITYQSERLVDNAKKLANELKGKRSFQCDLNNDQDITSVREYLAKEFGKIDFIAHCVAYAPKEDLAGRFVDTSRNGFKLAMETSVYSFVAAAKGLEPILTDNASLITLTYLGSERVMKNYNVMGVAKAALEASMRYMAYDLGPKGIRVNALSPGPINTLAARGVSGFTKILSTVEEHAPLKRNVEQEDIGNTAVFFFSDAARNISGEVLYIDAGYKIVGV
ncbi:MAG: enoyl-ACP reductase [bacterium]|jgi:enoyl-[acyl-carrier protein] reductase I